MLLEIISVLVDWHEGFSNRPTFKVIFNHEPFGDDELRYVEREGLYVSASDPLVSFYYYTGPGRGYGGREFPITMKSGEKITLKGPWSSSSRSVNTLFPELGGVIDVAYNYVGNKYDGLWYSGAVTINSISKWLIQERARAELAKVFDLPMVSHDIKIAKVALYKEREISFEPILNGIIKKEAHFPFEVLDGDWNHLKQHTEEELS